MGKLMTDFTPVIVLGIETTVGSDEERYLVANQYTGAKDTITKEENIILRKVVDAIEKQVGVDEALDELGALGDRGGELYYKFID